MVNVALWNTSIVGGHIEGNSYLISPILTQCIQNFGKHKPCKVGNILSSFRVIDDDSTVIGTGDGRARGWQFCDHHESSSSLAHLTQNAARYSKQ